MDRNKPLGKGGSWREDLSVTSGSRLVRVRPSTGSERGGGTYLVRLASVAEHSLAIAW